MATISSSIRLTDAFSGVLTRFSNGLDNASQRFDNLSKHLSSGSSAQSINNASNAQDDWTNSVDKTNSAMSGLVKTIKSVVSAYAGIQALKSVINIADEMASGTARLSNMASNFETTTDSVMSSVQAAANNSRASFSDMMDVVARFGNNAKDAFGSSGEVVAFSELVSKSMTIAGASTAESSAAMLQLSQALGSGVLRGDELNSIFEQAPNLIQNIADYLGVPIGKIRSMASEGQLTADIVKQAIFAASDEINEKFNSMPTTFGQAMTILKNNALTAFQPVLDKITSAWSSDVFQAVLTNAETALYALAGIASTTLNAIGAGANFIYENWSVIAPLIYGLAAAWVVYNATAGIAWLTTLKNVAAKAAHAVASAAETAAIIATTIAQEGLNAAMQLCPITWIINAIIILIAVIVAVAAYIAKTSEVADNAFSVICGWVNVAIQTFVNLGKMVANVALGIGSAMAAVGYNIYAAFYNCIGKVKSLFYSLLSTVLKIVAKIADALNWLPFIDIDTSGILKKADEYAGKASADKNTKEYKSVSDAFSSGINTYDAFKSGWVNEAYSSGASWGNNISGKVSDKFSSLFGKNSAESSLANALDTSSIAGNTASSADTTDDIAKQVTNAADNTSKSAQELEWLRNYAEKNAINKFTTAEIKVDMGGITQNVSSDMDVDGVVRYLASTLTDSLAGVAEGTHY